MNKRTIVVTTLIVIFIGAAYILGWSTLFTVSSVEILGTHSPIISSVKPGQKLARVEPRVIAGEFQKYDWIESAAVDRNWITGKVRITVVERTPIAIYNNHAIDAKGFSFIIRNQNISGLPQIQALSIDSALLAANFFDSLPLEITKLVRDVNVESGESFVLHLQLPQGLLELRWGQNIENALKVKVYKALLAQPENAKIKRIDLSAPHAPIVN